MTKFKLSIITISVSLFLVLIIAIAIYLSSGIFTRKVADLRGHATICVDGVNYIQFSSGASVKYNTDGTISTCE